MEKKKKKNEEQFIFVFCISLNKKRRIVGKA